EGAGGAGARSPAGRGALEWVEGAFAAGADAGTGAGGVASARLRWGAAVDAAWAAGGGSGRGGGDLAFEGGGGGGAAMVGRGAGGVDGAGCSRGRGDGAALDRLAGLEVAPPGTARVGLVATYARWKGQEVFLQAASQVDARFYVVGGPVYRTRGSQFSLEELR